MRLRGFLHRRRFFVEHLPPSPPTVPAPRGPGQRLPPPDRHIAGRRAGHTPAGPALAGRWTPLADLSQGPTPPRSRHITVLGSLETTTIAWLYRLGYRCTNTLARSRTSSFPTPGWTASHSHGTLCRVLQQPWFLRLSGLTGRLRKRHAASRLRCKIMVVGSLVSDTRYGSDMLDMPNRDTGGGTGLAAAVLRGDLRRRVGGRVLPFAPTAFDAELLGAAEAAAASGMPLAMVLPLPGTATPILLGAAALIAAVVRTRQLSPQVAVVSSHLAARTLYDELFFRDQRLADFIPRCAIGPEGDARVIGRPTRDAGGRLYLVNSLSRLDRVSRRLDGIVVEAGAVTGDSLPRVLVRSERSVPLIYLTADPADPNLEHVKDAGGLVWGWDANSVEGLAATQRSRCGADAGPLAASGELLYEAGTSTTVINSPGGETPGAIDEAMALLWRALGKLSSARVGEPVFRNSAVDAIRWVWGIYNTLAMLPVAPARYDDYVGYSPYALRVGTAAVTARAFARNVHGQGGDAWHAVADALDTALAAAAREEKLSRLAMWVAEQSLNGERAVVLTRNRAAKAATASALDESTITPPGWKSSLTIATLADLSAARVALDGVREICVLGPLPRAKAGLLALPPAKILRVLTAGPFETRRAMQQAMQAKATLSALRSETERQSAKRLGLLVRPGLSVLAADQVRLVQDHHPVAAISDLTPADDGNPWEPFDVDIVALLRRAAAVQPADGEEVAIAPARATGSCVRALVSAVAIRLDDHERGAVLLAAPNDLIARRRGVEVSRVAAKSIAPGDTVILVDQAVRHDLLDAVTEKLSEAPAYAPLTALIDFWHSRARRAPASGLTYREILARMTGTSITSEQTIGAWVRGQVNGPLDPGDVRRFAMAVRDRTLLAEAERVGWALKTMQSVHRKVGRWLSAQIAGAPSRAAEGAIIDVDLGVHVADLLESVTSHCVVHVDREVWNAPAYMLGVVLAPTFVSRVLRRAA